MTMTPSRDPEFNPYAAPKAELPTFAGAVGPASSQGLWAQGKTLIVARYAEFPDLCLKCGEPAEGYRLKRSLSWHPPAYFLIFLLSPIIYIIVALIVRKTGKIRVGLCERHRAARRNAILIGWGSFFLMIGLIVAAANLDVPEAAKGPMILAGIVLFLVGLIYSMVAARIVAPTKIDEGYFWLKGAGPGFLSRVEALPGPG